MNLQPVIDSLQGLSELAQVQYGAEVGREDVVGSLPAVYVAPFKEFNVAEPSNLGGVVIQTVQQTFVVSIVCKHEDLTATREAILTALIGKPLYPSGNVDVVQFFEGEQVEASGSLVHWRDVFSTRIQRRFV